MARLAFLALAQPINLAQGTQDAGSGRLLGGTRVRVQVEDARGACAGRDGVGRGERVIWGSGRHGGGKRGGAGQCL